MNKDMLIIPDCHASPDYDNRRFEALGNFIIKEQPEYITCLGDFADMSSLSSYDKGTKGFEGRRFKKDIVSAIDAQVKLFAPLKKFNLQKRKNKEKMLLGLL